MKLSVYLAEKIDQTYWRHSLVPDLRNHPINGGPVHTKQFIYKGPFFISCDHGCFHGSNKHGVRKEPARSSTSGSSKTLIIEFVNNMPIGNLAYWQTRILVFELGAFLQTQKLQT